MKKIDKETRKLADAISFRLLATNKHPDYGWLCSELAKLKSPPKSTLPSKLKNYWNLMLGEHQPIKK